MRLRFGELIFRKAFLFNVYLFFCLFIYLFIYTSFFFWGGGAYYWNFTVNIVIQVIERTLLKNQSKLAVQTPTLNR